MKHCTLFQNEKVIQNQFYFCCILHNILLKHNGYLSDNYEPDKDTTRFGKKGDGMWWNMEDQYNSGTGAGEDEGVTVQDEAGWIERIRALAIHHHITNGNANANVN